MPSPFPGMDPYLENRNLWQGFHHRLMTYVADALDVALPPNYVATIEVRVYYEEVEDGNRKATRVPDLELVRTGPSPTWLTGGEHAQVDRGGTVIALDPVEVREAVVNVQELSGGELITSIELLSPSNKRPGEGRDLYRKKQNEMVVGGVNLLEIDLLRGGAHTVLAPASKLMDLAPFHYLICTHRAAHALECEVFTWTVRDRIPSISVPLAREDREIELDVQSLANRVYDAGRFSRILDYGGEPRPPLAPEDAAWADDLLRKAGLRGEPRA